MYWDYNQNLLSEDDLDVSSAYLHSGSSYYFLKCRVLGMPDAIHVLRDSSKRFRAR